MKRIALRLLLIAGTLMTAGVVSGIANTRACDPSATCWKAAAKKTTQKKDKAVIYPDFALPFSVLRF